MSRKSVSGNGRESSPFDRAMGARVRGRRLEMGVSQEKLADMLGVTFQQVQKYEKGVNRIAAGRLYDIAQALELPVAAFYPQPSTREPGSGSMRLADRLITTDGGASMAKLWIELAANERPRVLAMLRAAVGP